ncbi:MAG: winged helix-turn-helix domain-containing protein [Pyrinomonadaceae bacterium]
MSLENYPGFLLNFSEFNLNGEEKHFYRFKSFRLDVGERQLFHHDTPVSLTPKAFDVLAVLVSQSGHLVEKDELLKQIWADSFVEEANISRIVHTLRKKLGEDENGNKFIETVATKGYRFVAKVTEDRQKTERREDKSVKPSVVEEDFPDTIDVDESAVAEVQIPPPEPLIEHKRPTRVVFFTVGFATAISLILLLSFNFWSKSAANSGTVKSFAVLPLKPINSTNRDEIYEVGIADSLIYKLSSMKGFIVRPLSATRKYADIEQDAVAAGREQQVDYVLSSNYQLADGKIKITAQLFNVATGQIEDTYKSEKEAASVFAMQDAFAGEVGDKLSARFSATESSPVAKRGTTNEEAYRLYLQGRLLTMQVNGPAQGKAIEYFEQAIKLDPNYALAYARMAIAYQRLGMLNHDKPGAKNNEDIINKALELDPKLSEAYVARGQLHLAFEWDVPAAEKDFLRALELEPNNDYAHWLYALLLASRKQFDEALTEIETAQAIDPSAGQYMMHRGRILLYARRYDEAVLNFERMMDLNENSFSNWMQYAYEMKGDEAKAYEIFTKLQERWKSEHREVYPKIYETAGWQGVKRKSLEYAMVDLKEESGNPFNVARECAMLGEKDQAFEFLNKAVEERKWLIYNLNVEPGLDSLRDDPRFDELVARVGLK